MADKEGLERDHLSATADAFSFSHLMFPDDGKYGLADGVDGDYSSGLSSPHFLHKNQPEMLSFGNFQSKRLPLQKSGISCSDSSSSSDNSYKINALGLAIVKRSGSGQDPSSVAVSPMPNQRTSKTIKSDNPTVTSHATVSKKEKLGERVAALQQLVSPFGKTDTSSVLQEAMGYIKFLHEQVQVLCCPYFQNLPFLSGKRSDEEEAKDTNIRSRGLCLVPVVTTLYMANNNGADLWSPTMKKSNSITKR